MVKRPSGLRQHAVLLLVLMLLIVGCSNLPMIGAEPKSTEAAAMAQWRKVFRKHLPQGAFLIEPSQDGVTLPQPALIQQADLDNDGVKELIAGYRIGETNVGVLVLKSVDDSWRKLWEARGAGPGLTLLHPADVTGDGVQELLVGWGLGSKSANQLQIISLHKEIRVLAEQSYHRLDVLDLPSDYGADGKYELAFWNRVEDNAYEVEVYRYHQGRLIPAMDTYKSYFPQVAEYYEQQVLAIPDKPVLWYYLADAQVRANQPEAALKSIERALNFDPNLFRPGALAVLKADALFTQGKLQEALSTYLKLARLDPEGLDRRDKAHAYYGLGRVKEAIPGMDPGAAKADYKKALSADPNWLPSAFALERIEAVPLTRALEGYLSSLVPEERAEGIAKLDEFAAEHNVNIKYLSQPLGKERLRVVAADYGPLDPAAGNVAHALLWWEGLSEGPVHSQVFYSAEEPFHGLCKNCTLKDLQLVLEPEGTVKAKLIYTLPKETGPLELCYELELEQDRWLVVQRDLR